MRIGHYEQGMRLPGGIASYIRNISTEQCKIGDDVFLYDQLSSDSPELHKIEHVDSFEDMIQKAKRDRLDILHLHTETPYLGDVGFPMIRTIHSHQPYCPSGGRYFNRSNKACNRNFSVLGCGLHAFTEHCLSIRPERMAKSFRSTSWARETLKHIPAITVSRFIKDQMARAGYCADNISVIYLPAFLPFDPLPPPVDELPHFTFLGRLTRLKGVDWLLRAVSKVESNIHVDIGGEGDQTESLKRLTKKLHLSDMVTFHGWLPAEAARELVNKSRAVVFPSIWHEPGGSVAYEAMASARAVIASRVGGISEAILPEVVGIQVEAGDTEGLAMAIDRLAQDYDAAREMGLNGRKRFVENYTLDRHMIQLTALYNNTIENYHRSHG